MNIMAQNNNSNQNSNMPKLADMAYVYAKMKWMQGFLTDTLEKLRQAAAIRIDAGEQRGKPAQATGGGRRVP